MKKAGIIIFVIAVIFRIFSLSTTAEEINSLPSEYYKAIESLPSEAYDYLPKDITSNDIDEVGKAVSDMAEPNYLLSLIGELTGVRLLRMSALFASLLGIIIFASIFSAFRSSIASESLSRAVSFCFAAAIFGISISIQLEDLVRIGEYFERISALFLAMIPTTGVVYAMGGNVSTAVSSGGTLYLFLAFCENFCAKTIVPISSISMAFSLCGAFSPSFNLGALSSSLKKTYTFIIGFVMTILLFILSTQTVLSSSADTIGARAAKLLASGVIPVVGGSVGETVRTLSSSVSYIKNVCGVGGIFFILVLLMPTLISLLLTRFVFMVSGAVANMLGCEGESKLLADISGIYGTMIAVVAMTAVMFILALCIFIKCTVAIG